MLWVLQLFASILLAQPAAAVAALPSFAEPAISPDRGEIAFVSGGDIWTAPLAGGQARLLISHPTNESRPQYSPDGRRLAFISNRTGNGDIYVLSFDSGELKRITFDDSNDQLDGWSRDGRWIYFTSARGDIAGMSDVWRIASEGGTPMPVGADRYASEFFAAESPDGQTLAITARGVAAGQWWRKGHSHLDEGEISIVRTTTPPTYERLSEGGAKEVWPMWNSDGSAVYYMSDRSGAQNLWMRAPGRPARQLTRFTDGRVLWPTISYDGRTIVFERNFGIWKFDTANGQATEIPLTRRGTPAGPAVERLTLTNQIQDLALSPDGKKVAFIVHGEVFAASAKDGGDAARVTRTPGNETQIAWAPDSRRLVYVSDREGVSRLFLFDFSNQTETRLTADAHGDASPRFSPDGKLIAFERNAKQLCVIDPASRQERVLTSGYLDSPPFTSARSFVWSPDSRWIAYLPTSGKAFTNAHVVSVADGSSHPVTFLANAFSNTISWSPDGTFLLFNSGQRTETGQVARVDLILRTPKFREDQFRDLFREETPRPAPAERRTETPAPPAAPPAEPPATPSAPGVAADEKKPASKPVEVVFADIRRRLSLLPVGIDVNYQTISPDGKTLLLIGGAAGQQNLYLYSLDELAREAPVARQLTSTSGSKSAAQFSPDGKEVFYLEQGRIQVIPVESRQSRALAVTAEMDVDFAQEKLAAFHQAWTYLRDQFYDPGFHGADWEAVRTTYAPRIAGSRTPDEMRRLIQMMVGELNASHLGIQPPFAGAQASTGRTGLRFDRAEYERSGKLRITEVLPLSPAALSSEIQIGRYLLAVDGIPVDARANLDELLDRKIGRRVSLTVATSADGAGKREVALQPVNLTTEKGLLYRQWVDQRRAYVERASGGRLGYAHMFDMSTNSLNQLHVDLDSENHGRQGVVIDVRNNNGGFVNAYALDVLSRRPYLTMTGRGLPPAPARPLLGQRALELPTILVVNQHSLSDAEDFTEGYRTLGLGKVVGEPTAGWIIYTSNLTLIDGSVLRVPFIKITANDGSVMELKPRPVDIPVVRPIGESYSERDSQLDRAVVELLKQLDSAKQR